MLAFLIQSPASAAFTKLGEVTGVDNGMNPLQGDLDPDQSGNPNLDPGSVLVEATKV